MCPDGVLWVSGRCIPVHNILYFFHLGGEDVSEGLVVADDVDGSVTEALVMAKVVDESVTEELVVAKRHVRDRGGERVNFDG